MIVIYMCVCLYDACCVGLGVHPPPTHMLLQLVNEKA
jgi:hypothetical protein